MIEIGIKFTPSAELGINSFNFGNNLPDTNVKEVIGVRNSQLHLQ